MKPLIITVDGPSGSGKGTISAYLSETFSLKHIDSGLIYRLAGLWALEKNLPLDDLQNHHVDFLCNLIAHIKEEDFAHPDLRKEHVASAASKIAILPNIRNAANRWMHHFTQNLPPHYKGAIIDGRDIGTVVFPSASLKFFITADEEVRLKRRFAQSDENTALITKILQERDLRDSSRKTAPLLAAKDAITIDTSNLSLDATCHLAAQYVLNTLG